VTIIIIIIIIIIIEFVEVVKNRHCYVIITSLFINIYSSLNQIGSRPAMIRIVGGGVVGNCVQGILIEDDHPKQITTRISIFKNKNLFRKIQTGRR
jgi:hypothetical protein